MLRDFLDRFGFDYEFVSASDRYNSGGFDDALRLRARAASTRSWRSCCRRCARSGGKTYSPVLPVSAEDRRGAAGAGRGGRRRGRDHPLRRRWTARRSSSRSSAARPSCSGRSTGRCAGSRSGVDYEMCGKDLTDSVTQSGKIVRVLGGRRARGADLRAVPRRERREDLQVQGQRPDHRAMADATAPRRASASTCSASRRAPSSSTSASSRARSTNTGSSARSCPSSRSSSSSATRCGTCCAPTATRAGDGRHAAGDLLACCSTSSACSAPTRRASRSGRYLGNYVADADPAHIPSSTRWSTARSPTTATSSRRRWRAARPSADEAAALAALDEELAALSEDATAEELQNDGLRDRQGREHFGFESLRDWFKALYETLLGSSQGPRMGSFIALYGVANTRRLIAEALGG